MSEQPQTPATSDERDPSDEHEPQDEQERARQEENAESSLDQPSG